MKVHKIKAIDEEYDRSWWWHVRFVDQKDNSSIAEQKASVSFLKHEAKPNFKHLLNLFGSLSLSVSCYIKEAMGSMFSSPVTKEQMENALTKAKNIVSSNPVVVFRYK